MIRFGLEPQQITGDDGKEEEEDVPAAAVAATDTGVYCGN